MNSENNSQTYDAYYYAHGCGDRPYQRDEAWLRLYDGIAERIVQDIQPDTILDAGCALGLLVEGLRKRDVETYGIDISEFAIKNVHKSVKPYCQVRSILEPFPQKYDLIVTIEVLEHLPKGQSEQAVANLCEHSDDILFSSSPLDYKEPTHFNVQPPEYWVNLFARHGFYRDVDFDASFVTPWAVRFRKLRDPIQRVIAAYERKLWLMVQDQSGQHQLNLELRNEVSEKDRQLERKEQELEQKEQELEQKDLIIAQRVREIQGVIGQLEDIRRSQSWRLMRRFQRVREAFITPGGRLETLILKFLRGVRAWRRDGTGASFRRVVFETLTRTRSAYFRFRYRRQLATRDLTVPIFLPATSVPHHTASVDIVVCVHNALDDVQRCLQSVVRYALQPYHLIVIDDGSATETQQYLEDFSESQGVTLIRNEQAQGYTLAANIGLRASTGDYVILLNSDTIVTPRWLDRLVNCAETDPKIGIVGPLSNTASWQSVPEIFDAEGDWADNVLPEALPINEMARRVAVASDRIFPRVPFLNGFCLMIKRALIEEIGYFDDETFGAGYGEENDYCIRTVRADWDLAIADDVYIYHAQSKSYSTERRIELAKMADAALIEKHGHPIILQGLQVCRNDPSLLGIRARNQAAQMRANLIAKGMARWEGKRVIFILPIAKPGGGGHVIVQEAQAIQKMGVDVCFLNLKGSQASFEASFPENTIPVIYAEEARLSSFVLNTFDVVIATVYHTVEWMEAIVPGTSGPLKAYYIQDVEPWFFEKGSPEYRRAKSSYTYFPDMIRFAKTEWNARKVNNLTGAECFTIGPSLDIDLFRPRPRRDSAWPDRPLRVTAMIRPSTPRRQAQFTMEVLQNFYQIHKSEVEIILFGCSPDDPDFHRLNADFPWRNAGILTRSQLVSLFNEIDIFVDFSLFQAMGLTAMEAMACGAAVIVPGEGGADSFAVQNLNAMIVNTQSKERCVKLLSRLVSDHDLRTKIQQQAIADICQFPPEQAAYNILETIFSGNGEHCDE